jgi:hypothetical protein
MFNALRYKEELEEAGFSRDQAEVSVRVLIDVMNENFATKSDLREIDLKLDSSVQRLEAKIDSVEQRLEAKIDSSLEKLEYKLTLKLSAILGAMLTLGLGLTATIVKLLQTN